MLKDPRSRMSLLHSAGGAGADLRLCRHLRPQSRHLRRARPGPQRGLAPAARGSRRFGRVRARREPAARERYRSLIDARRALLVVQIEPQFERQPAVRAGAPTCSSSPTAAIPTPPAPPWATSPASSSSSTPTGATTHGGAAAAGADRRARLVQPESRDALVHDSRHDRHADAAPDHDAHGDVGRARARAGHLRSAAGDAVSPLRDHGRQGAAVHAGRHHPGDRRAAGRAAVVSHSLRRLLSDAVLRVCCCSCWRRSASVCCFRRCPRPCSRRCCIRCC